MKKVFGIIVVGGVFVSVVSAAVYVFAGTSEMSVTIGKREQPRVINAARAGDWARIVSMQLAYEDFLRKSAEQVSPKEDLLGSTTSTTKTDDVAINIPVEIIPPTPVEPKQEVKVVLPEIKQPESKKIFTFSRVLRSGMRGKDVAELQKALQAKKVPLIIPRGQEGIFGPRTTAAVKLFQKQNKLRQTGVVDKMFAEVINR